MHAGVALLCKFAHICNSKTNSAKFCAKPEDAGIDFNNMYKAALLPSTDDNFQEFCSEIYIYIG